MTKITTEEIVWNIERAIALIENDTPEDITIFFLKRLAKEVKAQ